MQIGTLVLTLQLAEGNSLKDKRQVIKSLVETTRRKFNVSVAEIGELDSWRRAVIGIAIVSNKRTYCNQVLDKVLDYVESHPEFDVAGVEMELM